MPIDISVLARQITPMNTVLVLGAGASLPSGAPSGKELAADLEAKFKVGQGLNLSLSDLATLIEKRVNRRELIDYICDRVEGLTPTGGILSIPLFDWAAIFTTNYDQLVERATIKMVFLFRFILQITILGDHLQIILKVYINFMEQ